MRMTEYTKKLAILPFDHRSSYISGLFGWKEPLNVEQALTVAESKQVIYEGFKKARIPKEEAGILVDEQYGVDNTVLTEPFCMRHLCVLSVEIGLDYLALLSQTCPFIGTGTIVDQGIGS